VAAVDMLCGTHFVQGILAALIQRTKTKKGAWVEVSLLESAVDFQLEIFTTLLNNGLIPPTKSETNNAHSLLEAPYGIYKTQNSHIAISMGSLDKLFSILNIESKNDLTDGFKSRDSLKAEIAEVIETKTTEHWISELEKKNLWCSEVLNYLQILGSPEFETLAMKQTINLQNGAELYTTRCPIRINDEIIY
jgi:crotonobetainyl-CoA:carnitine CoA-transferase CaiB-like acyl-CoA transferase